MTHRNKAYGKKIKAQLDKIARDKEVRVGWSNEQYHSPNIEGETLSYATLAYAMSTGFVAIYPYDGGTINVPSRPLLDDAVNYTPIFSEILNYSKRNIKNLEVKKVGQIMYDNIMHFAETNPYLDDKPNSKDRVVPNKANRTNYPWVDTGELLKNLIVEVVKE